MRRFRAIVADDDADMLELVSGIVDQFGADVTRASSGRELLIRIAEDEGYDFIVTDIAMPWMSGLEVMHALANDGMRAPVIVMTAMREARLAEQVYALGEHATLLFKPFTFEELVSALQACVRDVEERHITDLAH
jgi:two-component system response regulator ResD